MLAEHNNEKLNPITCNAVTAASQLGDTSVLVAGVNANKVAEEVLRCLTFLTKIVSFVITWYRVLPTVKLGRFVENTGTDHLLVLYLSSTNGSVLV